MNKEYGLPIGATNVKAVYDGVEYPVDSSHIHTRTGENGSHPVLVTFVKESFNGEILPGGWRKWWDANMDADQAFVAKLDTTNGELDLLGEADVAGTAGIGGINQNNPILLIEDTEIVTDLEVPVSDSGAVANRDIASAFILTKNKLESDPQVDTDFVLVIIDVSDSGLLVKVQTRVNSSTTTEWDGSTKDGSSVRDPAAVKFWKFKFIPQAKPGTSGAKLWVYAKKGATRVAMEADSWERLNESGTAIEIDISDLAFHLCYPGYKIYSQHTSYFDDASPATSGSIEVSYPDFEVKYSGGDDRAAAAGSVQIYDGDPDGTGKLVESKDHVFTDDLYLQNGLVRLKLDELDNSPLIYCYANSQWNLGSDVSFYLTSSAKSPLYVEYVSTEKLTPEETTLKVRLHDTQTADSDYYVECDITLKRGSLFFVFDNIDTFPTDNLRLYALTSSSRWRFGYIGNDVIGDDDVGASANNTSLSDNYLMSVDESKLFLNIFAVTDKPDDGVSNYFRTYEGGALQIRDYIPATFRALTFIVGAIPFDDYANLFVEAEDATISAAARLYLDGAGEDTVTEGQAVWAATTNCVVDINDASDPQVGAKSVKVTSSAAGLVEATITVASALGKLAKFDLVKLWAWKDTGNLVQHRIWLYDADGDSVWRNIDETDDPSQLSYNLPHSDSDLATYGWNEVGTFNYETFNHIIIKWQAAGAGETGLYDGMHFYIGTTTTRGRGETLSGGVAVVLDAQNELVKYGYKAGTNLPDGLYLRAWRLKDTDQLASDPEYRVRNIDEDERRNQQNKDFNEVATGSFAYYVEPFHILSSDESALDDFEDHIKKSQAGENTIFVDYDVLMFLSNGKDGPLDQAHATLMGATVERTPDYL